MWRIRPRVGTDAAQRRKRRRSSYFVRGHNDMLARRTFMKKSDVSRRNFTLLAGTLAAGRIPIAAAANFSAQEVIGRIQTSLGTEPSSKTSDGFKAGDPNT